MNPTEFVVNEVIAKPDGAKHAGGVQVYILPFECIPGRALTLENACVLLFAVPAVLASIETVVVLVLLLMFAGNAFVAPRKPT